ncbi:replicative DNA helicase [Candidatus Pacearchaeota archaeon]|nr:replicative DNA helicase [Candidatus Pacearchaeota archaeon]
METRVPPQNLEAELSVLGGVLINNEAIDSVVQIISVEDFYKPKHSKIFTSMLEISGRGEPIDVITLTDSLKTAGILNEVGGPAYVASLADGVATAANISYYAKIVKDRSVRRKMINVSMQVISGGYNDGTETKDLVEMAESLISNISEKNIEKSFTSSKKAVGSTFKIIEGLYERKDAITGAPSGFNDLDNRLCGFQSSDLIIVAGRPSMGKTAFVMNVAVNSLKEASKEVKPVAIFSLEMSEDQLIMRMLCSEGRVDSDRLRRGYIQDSDWPKLTRAAGTLSEIPLHIDDTAGISVAEVRAKSRKLKRELGLSMVIIDYLQLMRGNNTKSREQEISEISRSLKALAKELKVPVIALSQLSRGLESRPDKRPILSDLRESGSLEQDADVVIFVFREEVYKKNDDDLKGLAEIIIGKQRRGPIGTVNLLWESKYTKFESLMKDMSDM